MQICVSASQWRLYRNVRIENQALVIFKAEVVRLFERNQKNVNRIAYSTSLISYAVQLRAPLHLRAKTRFASRFYSVGARSLDANRANICLRTVIMQ